MQEFYTNYLTQLNLRIKSYFSDIPSNTLMKSMQYSLTAGGKRLRPTLAAASTFALGKEPEKILDFSLALEFIHTYSLIHDDLPGMDDAALRRGKPTNHKVFSEGVAILAGDALLTEAFLILSKLDFPAAQINKVIELISYSSGLGGMCKGQLLDLEMAEKKHSFDELKEIIKLKTAVLIRASVLGPAMLFTVDNVDMPSDLKLDVFDALSNYGLNIGVAFQLVDDLLDITGKQEDVGKDLGLDQENRKQTIPQQIGINATRDRIRNCYNDAIKAIEIFKDRGLYLKDLAKLIVERDR